MNIYELLADLIAAGIEDGATPGEAFIDACKIMGVDPFTI